VRLSVGNARDLYEWVEQYGAGPIEITGGATSFAQLPDDDSRPRRRKRARRPDMDDEPPFDRFYNDYDRLIRGR
jgi:hypothetical protein